MENIIKIISKYVYDGEEVPEDLLFEFSSETARIIGEGDFECIPDEFWQLENYVELYWRGSKYARETKPKRIYQMGQLLSFTNMISAWYEKVEKDTSLEQYADMHKNKYSFFRIIHEESGITHKALADKMQISTSALSQFVNRVKGEGFFVARTMGREKHYYLTAKGENLFSIMMKSNRPPERRFSKLRDELDNLVEVIKNDQLYKVVRGEDDDYIRESIYLSYKIDDNVYRPLLQIAANRMLYDENREGMKWEKERELLNRIS